VWTSELAERSAVQTNLSSPGFEPEIVQPVA